MRLFYTLLASTFLVLSDVPTEISASTLYSPHQYQSNANNNFAAVNLAKAYGDQREPATSTPVPLNATSSDSVLTTYRGQSTLPVTGYAMYYNPNVMQEVLSNRLRMGHISQCAECVGNVALLRAGDLNRRVWLQWSDGTVEGPFLVADVAAQHHVAQLLARNWVVDVDNRTAVRRKMAGPVMVTVWGSPPASATAPQDAPFAPLYAAPTPSAYPTPSPFPSPFPSPTPVTVLDLATAPAYLVQGGGFPTDTPVPTVTPLPALVNGPVATGSAPQANFPADTPVPTVTPLPALDNGNSVNVPPVLATAAPLQLATQAPMRPANTLPTPDTEIQHAFPPDTPVPTITPLPALNTN